jgi:hypothetical protein
MVAQSDGMIAPIKESATSIQTIPISNDIWRVTIRQEGQLIMFADATSYGEGCQNQQQEPLHTMTGVSTIVNGEIDYEEMPDLYFEEWKRFWNRKY